MLSQGYRIPFHSKPSSSVSTTLSGCAVQWFTDNCNIPLIISNGSMKSDLHHLALSIFRLVLRNSIDLQVDWIPRSRNEPAAAISRIVDYDDWSVSLEFVHHIDQIWGPYSVDRFLQILTITTSQVLLPLFESWF